jgi:hypothetical protein
VTFSGVFYPTDRPGVLAFGHSAPADLDARGHVVLLEAMMDAVARELILATGNAVELADGRHRRNYLHELAEADQKAAAPIIST